MECSHWNNTFLCSVTSDGLVVVPGLLVVCMYLIIVLTFVVGIFCHLDDIMYCDSVVFHSIDLLI